MSENGSMTQKVKRNTNVTKVGKFHRYEGFKSDFKFNAEFAEYMSSTGKYGGVTQFSKSEGVFAGNSQLIPYIPSALNVEAFNNQINKYDYDTSYSVDDDSWELSLNFVERLYQKEFCDSRLATHSEIMEYVLSRDMDEKSPGTHFKMAGYPDKYSVYKKTELINSFINDFSKPEVGPTFWSLFLKSELRDAVKVSENNTRLFECASATLQYVSMMYCLHLQQSVLSSYKFKPIVSKMSRFSGEWDELIRRLGPNSIHATDGSKWDKRIRIDFVVDFFDMLAKYVCKTDKDFICWANICREHVRRFALGMDDNIYLIKTGFPSGSFFTMLFNSLHHVRLFAYMFIKRKKELGLVVRYEDFEKLKFVVCGDDNFFKSDFIDRDYYKESVRTMFDVEYLDGNTVFTLPFLGSRTVYVRGRYIPVLDEDKQFSSAFYVTNLDPVAIYSKVAALALNIAFTKKGFEGKTYYEWLYGFKNWYEKRYPDLKKYENCWFNLDRAFFAYTELKVDLNGSNDTSWPELGWNKVLFK